VADASKSATATITILPAVVVSVSPPDQSLGLCATLQFTATVQNAIDSNVTWSISGTDCAGTECGTISATGLYTAPCIASTILTITVTATSVEDPAISHSVTISIVSNAWTWVSGSNSVNQTGSYGIKGTAAPSNVSGARREAISWIDSSGKLWLFGGNGPDSTGAAGILNDLWRFDPATLEWTWISGSNTINQAGIYGTKGTASSSNVPGARVGSASWIDSSGKLWLFGGNGYDSAGSPDRLNDLWEFGPGTLEWTWVSGSNIVDQLGIYGTKGIADSSNTPGAKTGATSWIDSSGKLWLFGGYGYDSAGNGGWINDLWKYDPTTFSWTWVSGGNIISQLGIYGTKGIADSSNTPGAKTDATSWIDSSGKLWLFGGYGYDSAGNYDGLNDLWKYDPTTLNWTWVSGSNIVDQLGIYGTKGIADLSNIPGARASAKSWIDSSSRLWLFGGYGYDSAGNYGGLNDLWRFSR
jgi:N-acetylneuraminic acid mutarotase